MSTSWSYTPQVSLVVRRCYDCARYWAQEAGTPQRCPYCAHSRAESLLAELEKAGKRIIGLKGALTKAKKAAR